jgi:guanine deaminase
MVKTPQDWMRQAIELAVQNVRFQHGGPFGALVVRDSELVGSGVNSVIAANDPTAHAEIVAIRAACQNLNSFQLTGCDLYSSCEPCPMCMGAIYWARPQRVYFGCTRRDADEAGFDDRLIYHELSLAPEARAIEGVALLRDEALAAFAEWRVSPGKIRY